MDSRSALAAHGVFHPAVACRTECLAIVRVILAFACVAVGGLISASTPRALASVQQLKGALMVPVMLRVVDAQSAEPLPKAEVTFFTAREVEMLDAIAAGKRPAPADKNERPRGVAVHSTKNGEVRLTCEFDATFVEAVQNGEPEVTDTRIEPSGRFVVTKAGYQPLIVPAKELFAKVHGGPKEFGRTITLRLHKSSERS